jgi:hypothetical protein
MKIEVNKSDISDVEYMLRGIKNGAEKALVTSINATLTTTNTQAAKAVGSYLALTAKRIKKDFTLQKANFQNIKGAFVSSGDPIGIYQYAARQLKTGVSFKVLRKGKRQTLKHAFIAKGKSTKAGTNTGNLHVFWRSYNGERNPQITKKINYGALPKEYRLPLERKTSSRIEDALSRPSIINPLEKSSAELLQINLGKKVDEILRRFNG